MAILYREYYFLKNSDIIILYKYCIILKHISCVRIFKCIHLIFMEGWLGYQTNYLCGHHIHKPIQRTWLFNSALAAVSIVLSSEASFLAFSFCSRRCRVNSVTSPAEDAVKCLGVWWCSNFSSRKSIEERINKARGAFFAHGQLGAFHGLLNPLSSRSFIESCVIPVLMYGAESWCL